LDNKAPDAFRTISEVADELDLPQHVLRFWESRFHEIKPMKRGGGRRYYRPDDIDLLRGIRHLLYGEGYTIRGVQRILREQGVIGGTARVLQRLRERRHAGPRRAALAGHYGGYAADVAQAFAAHAVVLNFSNVWSDGKPGSTLIPHVRLRDFEGPMSRSCYLTGYTDEIEHFFEVGREVDCYRSVEELVDKTRFYLNHPTAAESLREAGWQRARRDHRWENRFHQLFTACGLG
jgi:DNA-binding transcriptional MerR regulator